MFTLRVSRNTLSALHGQNAELRVLNLAVCIYIYIYTYTGCPGRNVPDFGRMFLKLKYTDLTKNTYIRS